MDDLQVGWNDIEAAMPTFRAAPGGLSDAKRGIVTLSSGQTYFVKLGVDSRTQRWAQAEIQAYHWLNDMGYRHAPQLIAESDTGFALPDLSTWDWEHIWHDEKVVAALSALDSLSQLSTGSGAFGQSGYDEVGNPWEQLPDSTQDFESFIEAGLIAPIAAMLADRQRYAAYISDGNKQPWHGNSLVHYDARADNFAYDHQSRHGCFVDWNWLSLGSTAFDRTALLVNVELSGFDIVPSYRQYIDVDSLVWQAGFWLLRALGPRDTADRKLLRPRQVANALQAYLLLRRLHV